MTVLSPEARGGLPHALGAHAIWGAMPIYLLLVRDVPAPEFVAWRVIFTLPLCVVILIVRRRHFSEIRRVLADRRAMLTLVGSAAMIGLNWFFYVWAIQDGHVYAASLGYYILPLIMMLLGLVVLKERLNRRQWWAIALAGLGVGALAVGALTTLWLSLAMGIPFGIYGLLRKTVAAGPVTGLTLETLLLLPIALAVIGWAALSPQGMALGRDPLESFGIVWSGPMTALPLLLFATAARRMPYTVVGFLQFLAPTIVFLAGLLVFGERLQPAQLACFIAIWIAAALFIWDLLRGHRGPPGNVDASRGAAN